MSQESVFRRFEGDSDLEGMYAVTKASMTADGMDMHEDFESFCNSYSEFEEILPAEDVLVVECQGKIIGHARVWWKKYTGGRRLYSHASFVLPEFTDARKPMIEWAEARLASLASDHPPGEKYFETQCVGGNPSEKLVRSMGYEVAKTYFEMLRPLTDIPNAKVPGITVRQIDEDEIGLAWSVTREAFRGQKMFAEENFSEERLQEKLRSPLFDMSLWLVACSGNRIVGSSQNYIKVEENLLLGRRRGNISNLCVSADLRGRGIAKAILSASMQQFAASGMNEARLGVDSENPSGALRLYQSCGFRVSNRYLSCLKPLK